MGLLIVTSGLVWYSNTAMTTPSNDETFTGRDQVSTRIIQEYVPGRQVTIAHVIANPDKPLCQRVGLNEAEAIGIMTVTPGESAIIAGDLALKAADVEIGFLDRLQRHAGIERQVVQCFGGIGSRQQWIA